MDEHVEGWPPEQVDYFAEKMAILIFEAKMTEEQAKRTAYYAACRKFRIKPVTGEMEQGRLGF